MSGRADLASELNALAERGAAPIQAARARRIRPAARRDACGWLWIAPAFAVAVELFRLASGAASPIAWPLLLALTFAPFVFVFLVRVAAERRRQVAQREALGAFDSAAGLQDRLVTADEFLHREQRDGFMEAALDDAANHVAAAKRATLSFTDSPTAPSRSRTGAIAAAAALLALAIGLGRIDALESPSLTIDRRQPAFDVSRANTPKPSTESVPEQTEEPIIAPPRARTNRPASEAARTEDTSRVGEQTKETRGNPGAGRPAEASSSQGSSNSKAAPTNQGQAAKVDPQRPAARKKNEPPKPTADDPPPPKKNTEDASGTTAGRGSSRGSNKNPATSTWSSKDQVTNPEDEAVEDDEEIEDEEEEQESRGGIQPNLRDRKPPVNRDLRIGFGNRKNPDANGRGGPSEQKKSRGVASLVLGVPVPDRIKGQPNRGKTKITQERIEPKPAESEPIAAQTRSARRRPIGAIPHRDIDRTMRWVIRDYFLANASNASPAAVGEKSSR